MWTERSCQSVTKGVLSGWNIYVLANLEGCMVALSNNRNHSQSCWPTLVFNFCLLCNRMSKSEEKKWHLHACSPVYSCLSLLFLPYACLMEQCSPKRCSHGRSWGIRSTVWWVGPGHKPFIPFHISPAQRSDFRGGQTSKASSAPSLSLSAASRCSTNFALKSLTRRLEITSAGCAVTDHDQATCSNSEPFFLESVLGVGFLRVRPGGFAVKFFLFFWESFSVNLLRSPSNFLTTFSKKIKRCFFFILLKPKSKTWNIVNPNP